MQSDQGIPLPSPLKFIDGWVLIDKPEGMSSTQVGGRVKKTLRRNGFAVKHLGHVGTLDPLATGLLIVAVGQATKLIPYLEHHEALFGPQDSEERPRKTYAFDLRFGQETTTGDAAGEIVEQTPYLPPLTDLQAACPSFLGLQRQRPPMYSALKFQGRKLYELARRGEKVDVPKRTIFVESLSLLDYVPPVARFQTTVSQGTYIRSLGQDLARAVGSLGHLASLRRLQDGKVCVQEALSLQQFESYIDSGETDRAIIPLKGLLGDIPAVPVLEEAWRVLRTGASCIVDCGGVSGICRVEFAGQLVAMGCVQDGVCSPKRLVVREKGEF